MMSPMRAECYWNLHKKVWSVRDMATGRVIDHRPYLVLSDVTFVSQRAGRERVRREGRKNVHAFARGSLSDMSPVFPMNATSWPVTYNPYEHDTFVFGGPDPVPVYGAALVELTTTVGGKPKVWAFGPDSAYRPPKWR